MFYFVFDGNFQVQAPQGGYIWRGDLTEGFWRYEFGGLIFGEAYTKRGLFSEFYGKLENTNYYARSLPESISYEQILSVLTYFYSAW